MRLPQWEVWAYHGFDIPYRWLNGVLVYFYRGDAHDGFDIKAWQEDPGARGWGLEWGDHACRYYIDHVGGLGGWAHLRVPTIDRETSSDVSRGTHDAKLMCAKCRRLEHVLPEMLPVLRARFGGLHVPHDLEPWTYAWVDSFRARMHDRLGEMDREAREAIGVAKAMVDDQLVTLEVDGETGFFVCRNERACRFDRVQAGLLKA